MRPMPILLVCLISTAAAAQEAAPPVEQMDCDALWAETMQAGLRMSGQMTPEFAAQAQAMHDKMNDPALRARATGQMGAVTAACGVPGVSMVACAPAQQAYAADMNRQAQEHRAEMAGLHSEFGKVTAGVDMQRMQAVQARLGKLNCPQPRGLAE